MSITNLPDGLFATPNLGGGGNAIMTTGNNFFVSSIAPGRSDAADHGKSPDTPFATIDFAVGRCTAVGTSNSAKGGDVIYVMPGHAENISSATSLVIDVAGITIIGLGQGRARPVLTFTATAGSVEMDAANCSIQNIVFFSSITAVVVGINVDAADCSILGCEFDYDATGDDFITGIDADAVDRVRIEGCRFIAENGVTGMAEAIRLDTANECVVRGNDFTGDFTDGVIVLEGAASNSVDISDNRMWNGHANNRYIVNSVASNGLIDNNLTGVEDVSAHAQQLMTKLGGAGLNWQIAVHRSSAFDGATGNAHGDKDGTLVAYELFTVTGDIIIKAIWGIVNVSLTGACGTIEVGTAGNTAALLAQEVVTDLDDGAVYVSGTVADGVGVLSDSGAMYVINDGVDIVETCATTDVAAGQIDYYCIWAPAEDGASLVSAPIDTAG